MANSPAMVRNVLLLTIDSVRLDMWRERYPELQAASTLAADGVSFDQAFATGPGTTSSFPGLLTGTMPLSYDGLGPLADNRPRVAEALDREGFRTAAFHSNPFLSSSFNYDTGFETFRDYQNPLMGVATRVFPRGIEINNASLARIDEALHLTDAIKRSYRFLSGRLRPYVSADVVTEDCIDWLAETREPFFCWTHYMDVHHPCYPPESHRAAHGVEAVDPGTVAELYSSLIKNPEALDAEDFGMLGDLSRASMEYVDSQIARIIEHLRDRGRLADTLIVLTSDHGELFGDHGMYGKPARILDTLIRVPFIVHNGPPELETAASDLVSLLDIPPLIHHALDVPIPEEYEGRVPLGETRELIRAEHAVEDAAVVGARSDRWLYEIDTIEDTRRLFDVRDRNWEQVESYTPDADRVRQAAEKRVRMLDEQAVPDEEPELEADVEARLTHLGYR